MNLHFLFICVAEIVGISLYFTPMVLTEAVHGAPTEKQWSPESETNTEIGVRSKDNITRHAPVGTTAVLSL